MLYLIWERYHLNDLKAGSPLQEEYIREWKKAHVYTYTGAKIALESVGLNPDITYLYKGEPYRYGSAWLYEEIPQHVLEFLASLPETTVQPAWV